MEKVYSEHLLKIAKTPKFRGAIFQMEADDKGLALVESKVMSLKVYLLLDPDSDTIIEARFFTYGGPAFTALAETLCETLQGKKMEFLESVTVEYLEVALRDTPDARAMPIESPELEGVRQLLPELIRGYPDKKNVAIAARAARSATHYKQHTVEGRTEADTEWFALSEVEQLRRVEACLDEKVRPALHMDGGGLDVLDLSNGTRLKIRYQGACNSCGASTGGTLIFIENQMRESVYYNISVEPETPDWLNPIEPI